MPLNSLIAFFKIQFLYDKDLMRLCVLKLSHLVYIVILFAQEMWSDQIDLDPAS